MSAPTLGALRGQPFWKMSGSGNDFVFVDDRSASLLETLGEPSLVDRVCARGTGVGADGIVFLRPATDADYAIVYLNSDGSRASLCGNATLCSARLATELGIVDPAGFTVRTDAGLMRARIDAGRPEIDFAPVERLEPDSAIDRIAGERRIGFAVAGVPHLVVLVDDLDTVEIVSRGRPLRRHAALGSAGANVNFVAPSAEGWRVRTYERGVEGETLACGTGAVATAAVLAAWGAATGPVELVTRSGRSLRVRHRDEAAGPSLAGEGRIVFTGSLRDL